MKPRAALRSLVEVDLATHAFYAQAYLLRRAAPWQDAPPDVEALAPYLGRPGRALDLGCGPGRNSLHLARAGWQVLGIDLYPWVVRRARRAARAAGVADRARFECRPVSAVDGDPHDLVLDVLGPASDLPREALAGYGRRLAALTAEGGRVLVHTFLTEAELAPLQSSLRLTEQSRDPLSRWLTFEPAPRE